MRATFLTFAFGLALLTAQAGLAADGAQLYAKCAGCHGPDGTKVAMGMTKPMKGMAAADVSKALAGYKAKTYGGEKKVMMEGVAKNLSDEDVAALADFISKL